MKPLYALIAVLLLSTSVYGQSLRFKTSPSQSSGKSFNFEISSFKGNLRGNHQQLQVRLKNTTNQALILNEGTIKLVDITGRGEKLCGASGIKIQPGEKVTLTLVNCDTKYNDGLFQLRREYTERKLFYEDASFLRNKTFELIIAGERIKFLTDL